jgi:hypothetical protein
MNFSLAVRKTTGYLAALAIATFTLAGTASAAKDQARETDWQAQQVVAAADGTSRVLWTADTTSGTVAGVWKMDASGNKIGSGAIYGPYNSPYGYWQPTQLAVAHDGTCRLLWIASDSDGTEADVWSLDTNGNETSYGTVYGPYSDINGSWYPQDLEMAPDGTSRLLWENTNDNNTGVEAIIWKLDASGNQLNGGTVYGPYYDANNDNWEPYQLLVAPDGTSRLLWLVYGQNDETSGNYTGDTMIIWKFDTNGNTTGNGPAYGPYPGWGVANFDMDTSDSSLRMLWENFGTYDNNNNYSGDIAGIWSFDTNGNQTKVGQIYGPYSGWSADALAALPDGTSRVEWDNLNSKFDEIGLWGFNSSDSVSFEGPAYGPYNGWILQGIDIARSDNTFRLLWTRDDDAAGLWSVNSSGSQTSVGPTFGPYTYP